MAKEEKTMKEVAVDIQQASNVKLLNWFEESLRNGMGESCPQLWWMRKEILKRMFSGRKTEEDELQSRTYM